MGMQGHMRELETDRRRVLGIGGLALAAAAAPSMARAEDRGGTDIPTVEFAFAAKVLLAPTVEIGRTPLGMRRRVPIIGGTFEGPRIKGIIVPGGADWQLQRADDYTEIEADYMIEASDGTQIHVMNRGLTNTRVKGATRRYLRTVPRFEAPSGPHEWLNQSIFVGGLKPVAGGPPAVMIEVFRVI
jgi:hypothetical protein